MQIKETHIVENLENPIRFQEYAVGIFNSVSTKSGIKKAIKKELIFIDKHLVTTSKYISGGEKIELFTPKNLQKHKSFHFDLEILFEDNYLAIIYKPAGVLVSGNSFATIDNCLLKNLKYSSQFDAVKPRPVHRLDYPTSGVLLIGKTTNAIIRLNKLFENKEIQKTYFAITIGKMEHHGEIDLPIDDKNAITEFEVLESLKSNRFDVLNLVKLTPKTGRKHQLRKHLLAIENPILGDKDYFLEDLILNGKGLYLHASTLTFIHPFTKEKISILKKLPKKFNKIFPNF